MICGNSSAKTPGYEIQGVYGGGDKQCGLTSSFSVWKVGTNVSEEHTKSTIRTKVKNHQH
jgi:hypothetical protein